MQFRGTASFSVPGGLNVTKDGFKDRQLHMEDYLQMVPAEQGEHAEVSAYQRITENNDIVTDFWTDNLMELILRKDNLLEAMEEDKDEVSESKSLEITRAEARTNDFIPMSHVLGCVFPLKILQYTAYGIDAKEREPC